MDPDPELGRITVSVGNVRLLFKNPAEAAGAQVFVKCTFNSSSSDTSILFPTKNPAAGGLPAPAGSDRSVVPTPLPIESKPVDIVFLPTGSADAIDQSQSKAGADDGRSTHDTDVEKAVDVANTPTAGGVVILDLGFSFQSAKFALADTNMSKLGAIEVRMEVCMRGGGEGESASEQGVTVLGSATARICDVLQGKNTWNNNLALGAYASTAATPTDAMTDRQKVVEDEEGTQYFLAEMSCILGLVFLQTYPITWNCYPPYTVDSGDTTTVNSGVNNQSVIQ